MLWVDSCFIVPVSGLQFSTAFGGRPAAGNQSKWCKLTFIVLDGLGEMAFEL